MGVSQLSMKSPCKENTGFCFSSFRGPDESIFSFGRNMRACMGFPCFFPFPLLPLDCFCDISSDYSALNGKIACLQSPERAGRRLKACLELCRLVRPGAAPERGTARPAVIRGKSAYINIICTNAGGTAEGLPFVPELWTEGFFFFAAAPAQSNQHPKKEFYT